jgi:hypothetical protein
MGEPGEIRCASSWWKFHWLKGGIWHKRLTVNDIGILADIC